MRISVTGSRGAVLTDQDRAAITSYLEAAPWFIRPMLIAVNNDPIAFRAKLFTIMPRVFFAMLPVFAGIVRCFTERAGSRPRWSTRCTCTPLRSSF